MEGFVRACTLLFVISCLGNVCNGATGTSIPPTSQSTLAPTSQSTSQPTSAPTSQPTLNYRCNSTGIVNITESNDKIVLIGNGTYCSLTKDNCSWKNKMRIQVLYSPDEKDSRIIGGKTAFYYDLECLEGKEYDANATASLTVEGNTVTPMHETVEPPKQDLILTINNKDGKNNVLIGEELTMTLTGPDGYTVKPTSCVAYPGEKVDASKNYTIWSNCKSQDTAVIGENWAPNGNKVSVKVYAFRFVDSKTVKIVCFAHLCPSGGTKCAPNCTGSSAAGRRRRDTNLLKPVEDGSMDDTASATFTIVDHLSTPNSSPGIQPFMLFSVTCSWIATVIMKN